MTDNTQELDEILLGYGAEEGEFTESLKQALLDWHNKQIEEVLGRLESNKETLYWWTGGEYEKTKAVDMRAIAAERAKLKEVK